MNPDQQKPTPEEPQDDYPTRTRAKEDLQRAGLPQWEKPVIGPDGLWTKSFAELAADLVGGEGAPPDLSYNPDHMRDFGK
ncbi:MAG TPA: hypothetical protein PLD23_01940 [Armatimonadota bacterium]|nr:hypothetical protein [Armatimonadota bacterium]HQK92234.1 hypothetical protein [Armatimonadota bacterium]